LTWTWLPEEDDDVTEVEEEKEDEDEEDEEDEEEEEEDMEEEDREDVMEEDVEEPVPPIGGECETCSIELVLSSSSRSSSAGTSVWACCWMSASSRRLSGIERARLSRTVLSTWMNLALF
jgi:archaellum component FlaD/FlaE